MDNQPYEVVAVVLPEEAADPGSEIPCTVLISIYETDCLVALDSVIQNFVKEEKQESYYRTIPVGSTEDFVEYWLEFSTDATEIADRLRDQLAVVVAPATRARRSTASDGTRLRPDGLAA